MILNPSDMSAHVHEICTALSASRIIVPANQILVGIMVHVMQQPTLHSRVIAQSVGMVSIAKQWTTIAKVFNARIEAYAAHHFVITHVNALALISPVSSVR